MSNWQNMKAEWALVPARDRCPCYRACVKTATATSRRARSKEKQRKQQIFRSRERAKQRDQPTNPIQKQTFLAPTPPGAGCVKQGKSDTQNGEKERGWWFLDLVWPLRLVALSLSTREGRRACHTS